MSPSETAVLDQVDLCSLLMSKGYTAKCGLLAMMSNQSLSGVTPLNTLELLKSKMMSVKGKSCF